MTPPHSLTPSHFLKSRHCAFFKIFFPIFSILFFAACVNPRLVRSEPEPNRTNRNRFCSVPRFAKNRSVSICRELNLCHKSKNRTETDRLTERPGRVNGLTGHYGTWALPVHHVYVCGLMQGGKHACALSASMESQILTHISI